MKDDRLYAKFTLDFPDNHKIMPLSDAAFRCLVEATLWSRKQLTDGLLARRYAVARWSLEVLEELTSNDPINPSLIEVDDGYQIRDFAEHQETRADIEARRERNRIAGQKGGLAKAKQSAKRPAKQSASKVLSENVAETETYIKEEQRSFDAAFDAFWAVYPRKVGRKAAEKAYRKALADVAESDLISAAKAYAEATRGSDAKFVAHPTTWLNQGRWDEFTEAPPHAPEDLVREMWRTGSTGRLRELTGMVPDDIRWPDPEPEGFDSAAHRLAERRAWIEANRDEIVRRLKAAM